VPLSVTVYDNPEGWPRGRDIARLTAGLRLDRLDFLDSFTDRDVAARVSCTDLVSAATLAYYRGIAAQGLGEGGR